jgi:hypothetical protein
MARSIQNVIRLRTKALSLTKRKPLGGLWPLPRMKGSRPVPIVIPVLPLFVANDQPVAPVLIGV